jgi:HD-GYP domain-containing protein (c-di-GMP phosphodiesterase class II)
MAGSDQQPSVQVPHKKAVAIQSYDEELLKSGKFLVTRFHILWKTAQIHDASNIAVDQPVQQVFETLNELRQWDTEPSLHLKGDYLFLGEMKLRMDMEGFISFTTIIEEFKRRKIGGVIFKPDLKPEELKKFVYFLESPQAREEGPFERLAERARQAGIFGIELEPFREIEEEFRAVQQDAREVAKTAYSKAMTVVTEVMDNIKLGQAVSIKRAKRVVQSMVDLLLQEETTLLGLTTLRNHDVYTHNHSVNVCILSLAMGQRLGYDKRQLTELGISALFHDMGKAEIPNEVLNKPTEFTEEEWRLMRRHPITGVKHLIRLKGINEMTVRMAMGIFEHHLNQDLSGYPRLEVPWDVSLNGRIIGIVDSYDALTSSRVYNRTPYPPEKSLKILLNKSGTAFDPILLKLFVNGLGIFPIGTIVLLNTGEIGVVVQANSNPDRSDQPHVKLIAGPDGNELDGPIVDLSEQNDQGQHLKTILKTIDAAKYKIDVSRYFV